MKSICYKLLILSVLLFISWKGNAQDFLFSLGNTVNINSSSDTAGYIYDELLNCRALFLWKVAMIIFMYIRVMDKIPTA